MARSSGHEPYIKSPLGLTNGTHPRNGSGARTPRQRTLTKRVEEEEKVKRSRAWANAYELSQDLHDKQLEMLERKYGGHMRAKRAAKVIQHAYRQYCLNKNFDRLRTEAEERRLRRLSEFGRSHTIWTDMVGNLEEKGNVPTNFYAVDHSVSSSTNHHQFVSFADHFKNQTVNATTFMQSSSSSSSTSTTTRTVRVMQKSRSLNVVTDNVTYRDRKTLPRGMGLDLDTILESRSMRKQQQKQLADAAVAAAAAAAAEAAAAEAAIKQQNRESGIGSEEETNNNRNSYPELNDSSESGSPQDTPVEAHVDLPSVNFENLLESKETDILNDSFHSDSSQDGHSPRTRRPVHRSHGKVYGGGDHHEDTGDVTPPQTLDTTDGMAQPVHIMVDEPDLMVSSSASMLASPSEDWTPVGDDEDGDTYTKIFANTEVRLRKRKGTASTVTDNNSLHVSGDKVKESDSVPSTDRRSPEASPIWKRKSAQMVAEPLLPEDVKRMSNISEASEPESLDGRESREGGLSSSASSDTCSMNSEGLPTYHTSLTSIRESPLGYRPPPRLSDEQRKRMYRIGLNLFNK